VDLVHYIVPVCLLTLPLLHCMTFIIYRTLTPSKEPTGPPVPIELVPTTMKPVAWYPPPKPPGWGSTPSKPSPSYNPPYPKPPSWDSGGKPSYKPPSPKPPSWGSTPGKPSYKPPYPKPPDWGPTPNKPPSATDDWTPYPPGPGMDDDMSPYDDWPWGPVFPGKSSKTKAAKMKGSSWGTGKGGKSGSGCVHVSKAGKSWWQPSSWNGYDDDGGKDDDGGNYDDKFDDDNSRDDDRNAWNWNMRSKGSSKSSNGMAWKSTDDGPWNDDNPCVGYNDDRVWGKAGKGSSGPGYSILMDFQGTVAKSSSERIRWYGAGLSFGLLCFSMLL